jgi:toxin ParE1/3/4
MERYRLTQLAQADIDSAWFHIAKDRPAAADRFVERLKSHFEALAKSPFVGELRIDLAQDVRQSSVGSYVVLHRPGSGRIEIVRVIHGARDLFAEFRRPTSG